MIKIKKQREIAGLRRRALAAQGLLEARPFGLGIAAARKAINHIGYVQLDTISVVERAHNHTFRSRVPDFKPSMTNQLLLDRSVFEYWTHAAAMIPIADFRFSLPYKHAIKSGQVHWYKDPDKKLMSELLARIRSDGPLRSRELEAKSKKGSGWWDWKPAKKALEQLYMQGDLMVSDREGFQKTYDLTERVLPKGIDSKMPGVEEFAAHLLERQLRCHGLVSITGLTYQRRNLELKKAVKSLVEKRLAQGELEQLLINERDTYLIEAGALDGPLPKQSNRLAILSPFDNSVIQRDRLKALFQFDYKLECYVPANKRRYGYFSLPLLYRDEFIGRMDCKAHRKTRCLEIKSLCLELKSLNESRVTTAFKKAMVQFCKFQECDSVSWSETPSGRLAKHFHTALKSLC